MYGEDITKKLKVIPLSNRAIKRPINILLSKNFLPQLIYEVKIFLCNLRSDLQLILLKNCYFFLRPETTTTTKDDIFTKLERLENHDFN